MRAMTRRRAADARAGWPATRRCGDMVGPPPAGAQLLWAFRTWRGDGGARRGVTDGGIRVLRRQASMGALSRMTSQPPMVGSSRGNAGRGATEHQPTGAPPAYRISPAGALGAPEGGQAAAAG